MGSERPVTVGEDSHPLAALGDSGDRQILGADHEVYVDHGLVDAHVVKLFKGVLVVVLDAVGKSAAQSQMAGGVLVEQSLVEGDAALTDSVGHAQNELKCAV